MHDFRDLVSERASELQFAPRPVFQYDVFTFVDLFASPGGSARQADCASVFLHLLRDREQSDPGSMKEIYAELRPTVEHVADNQSFYDADLDIYGDFRDLAAQLATLCASSDARR